MGKTSNHVVIERQMINSLAFRGLSGTAHEVLMDFLAKRVMKKKRTGTKRAETWDIVNNGQIRFSYAEAERRGISRAAFQRALDQLIERGFIDVAQTGLGICKAVTLYAISERWRKWGTAEFVERSRPRKARWTKTVGFQPGHSYFPPKEKGESSFPSYVSDNTGVIETDNIDGKAVTETDNT